MTNEEFAALIKVVLAEADEGGSSIEAQIIVL